MRRFRRAIVRVPCAQFAEGITTSGLGRPDVIKALAQHDAYRRALERCGLEVIALEADDELPDSTFVEDTAVLIPDTAILCRMGASARRAEAERIRPTLERLFPKIVTIESPARVDGGDVLEADGHFFIGISDRTDPTGAERVASIVEASGYDATLVDLRGLSHLLHLKSDVAALGDGRLVATERLAGHPALRGWEIVRVSPDEAYAANLIRVNDHVVMPEGYPGLEAKLRKLGYELVTLAVSEFQKMNGGVSCLSLRF